MRTPSALARRTGRPAGRSDDGGYALVTVIGSLFVLSLLAMAALGAASSALPASRAAQDTSAAMAAAQAGVADLTTQVNLCRTYWVTPKDCPDAGLPMPDANGWTAVKLGGAAQSGRYRVRYLVTPEQLPAPETTLTATAAAALDGIVRSVTAADGTTSRTATRVPPAVAADAAKFRQTGLIRAEVTGEARGERRVVSADVRQPGFLRYIYYTDFESMDPQLLVRQFPDRQYDKYTLKGSDGVYYDFVNVHFYGVSNTAAQACQRYWYGPDGGTTNTRTSPTELFEGVQSTPGKTTANIPRQCDLLFTASDVVNGPMHTNDAIYLQGLRPNDPVTGAARPGATFTSLTTNTSWRNPTGAATPPATTDTTVSWFRGENTADVPSAGSKRPIYAPPVEMPWRSTETRDAAARGCVYTGATSIQMQPSGLLRVYSPFSRNLSAACGGTAVTSSPGADVSPPKNGVIHVQNRARDPYWTSYSCPAQVLGRYPENADDITRYDCREGDAFVQGVALAPITISAENDVVITDDITYAPSTTQTNVVGLVAEGSVEVYHPVGCKFNVGAPKVCPDDQYTNLSAATSNLTVQAAIISMAHSFTVQNYDKGEDLGTLSVYGGIYQRFRGPVGWTLDTSPGGATTATATFVTTGFKSKNYTHDRRMLDVPPPAFPAPTGAQWVVTHFAEQGTS